LAAAHNHYPRRVKIQTPHLSILLASVLALSVSLPVAAAENVAGINKGFQRLSETSANIPDKPGHTIKQITIL
jgi:hypothetical protein